MPNTYSKNNDPTLHTNEENSTFNEVVVQKNKQSRSKKRKKLKLYNVPQFVTVLPLSNLEPTKVKSEVHRYSSMPEINNKKKDIKLTARSYDILSKNNHRPFRSNFIVNVVSKYRLPKSLNQFNNLMTQTKLKIYRCQLNTEEESCCCSCNSDAMFEVMKSLYDCYKKKNCDHCNCILCGHLPRQERRLGEIRKSGSRIDTAGTTAKETKRKQKKTEKSLVGKTIAEKERILQDLAKSGAPLPEGKSPSEKALIQKIKTSAGVTSVKKVPSEKLRNAKEAGILTPLEGKTPAQKEKILRGLASHGIPLPEGKTTSEKKLIDKVRTEVGLPPEPKTAAAKEKYNKAMKSGIITPLEGKSPVQKEKNLRTLAEMGIPLPEGRTPSEKALIAKVKAGVRPPSEGMVQSEKVRKAKGEVSSLEGKTPEHKEKIIRGLAKEGLPLPEGKTKSEKDLISKIRAGLGLPPEPTTSAEREKYAQGQNAGLIVPLEGKSPTEKEKILKDLFDFGIRLPEGRTPSEKAIIAKIKASSKGPSLAASEKALIKKSKVEAPTGRKIGKPSLPPDKVRKLDQKSAKVMKEGKGPSDECICDLLTPEKDRISATARVIQRVPTGITSEKLRSAKAAGLLTPLEGKMLEQKEKIIRGLAKQGLPLPEGKTASEKKLIDKVRAELGLPPEPKTPSTKGKYARAQAAGLITPLEGKTAAQKEKILKGQANLGLPLPEGRTPSEKALISKVKAAVGAAPSTTSEKMRKVKAAGLLTPLEGKTPEQKEKILRGRVAAGLPLPEGKSPSEKELIKTLKATTGYKSPEGKTPSDREKFRKAKAAGLLTPLEGKTPSRKERIIKDRLAAGLPPPEGKTPSEKAIIKRLVAASPSARLEGKSPSQKEKILRSIAKQGLPLPEGRTPSEKALIDKVRAEAGPSVKKTQSENLKQAKAAGILTPLHGKTPEQKEKILKKLLKAHLPLPEGKTPSEKELLRKVRGEVGLPPEPKTPSLKEKYLKAQTAGIITPLEGKSPAEKQKILRKMHEAGLPLPEGRAPSEKSMIRKIKAETMPSAKVPSEKLRAAKAAGLLTPLEGKTPAQKEKILKGLAKAAIPLPEGKTTSEKELIKKVRQDEGLPPEPKSSTIKEKVRKAQAAGLITPLEGKSPAQKEKIIRALAEAGVPLPEGKTASEKALINKIQAEAGSQPSRRRVEASGPPPLLPDKARILDQKTAKGMKEGKGPSDECICSLLTPESQRESRKVLGKPLSLAGVPSEKLRKAKAAGLLTPLEGKSAKQKENILKGFVKQGLPLPEGKTASERKLIDKVRADMGLPPEPETVSAKKKYQKALAAGVIEPLEGKTPREKEKILRNMAQMGIPLPEGRTKSEKGLIAKIKTAALPPSLSLAPSAKQVASEKLRKAKASGLLTPLEGKTPLEKEKIIRGLAETGLPIPEGKTKSEKSMIQKVKAEFGLPPVPKTISEKEAVRKGKSEGLFTPLTGKTPAQKEKILKGLAEKGLPMPEGTTPSEKELVRKVRTDAGLPPQLTPSEKAGKIKTKTKKVGARSRKSAKGITASAKAAGIQEEYQDIARTTTCDRACGCDKKKIRFKHSYVKIRVTSPDISSLCPCPEECIPGVKHGVFTDNEGIKVTVGSAIGVPSYSMDPANNKNPNSIFYNYNFISSNSNESILSTNSSNKLNLDDYTVKNISSDKIEYVLSSSLYTSFSEESLKEMIEHHKNADNRIYSYIYDYISCINPHILEAEPNSQSYRSPMSNSVTSKDYLETGTLSGSSFDSALIVKTDSSLSLSSCNRESITTISVISLFDGSIASSASYSQSESTHSDKTTEEKEYFTNIIDYSALYTGTSNSSITTDMSYNNRTWKQNECSKNDVFIFRMSQTIPNCDGENARRNIANNKEPIFVINDLSSDQDIIRMLDEILSHKLVVSTSSIFVVVPVSDCETEGSGYSSTICIQMSESLPKWKNSIIVKDQSVPERFISPKGLKISAKGKRFFMEEIPDPKIHEEQYCQDVALEAFIQKSQGETKHKHCQVKFKQKADRVEYRGVSMDTTSDRPCCCPPKVSDTSQDYGSSAQCVASVVSELITPIIVKQGVAQGLSDEAYLNVPGLNLPSLTIRLPPRQLKTTPVRHCKVPACTGHKSCHELLDPPVTSMRPVPLVGHKPNKPCHFGSAKVKPLHKNETKCVGTDCNQGISRSPGYGLPAITPIIRPTGHADASCATCSPPVLVDGKEMSCQCSGVEKKIKLRLKCPCEHHQPPLPQENGKGARSLGCQWGREDLTDVKGPCPCKERRKGKNKNVICECPYVEEEPPPLEESEDFEWVDERHIRKMKSDLTQTTSGFKLNKKKKPPPEEEMSFEEALSYYKAFSSSEDLSKDVCHCEYDGGPKKISKGVYCECPYEPLTETSELGESLPLSSDIDPEEPFRGLKFVIGGKGSGSKGLSGICCFELLQESNLSKSAS